jgi:hypothetical protein
MTTISNEGIIAPFSYTSYGQQSVENPTPEEIVVGPTGGKQSKIDEWPSELPPAALLAVSRVMQEGARKYGSRNWHNISVKSELDHALRHALIFMRLSEYKLGSGACEQYDAETGRFMLEELAHAATRMLMALDQFIRAGEVGQSE